MHTRVNVTIDGVVFEADVDDTSSVTIVPCSGCDDCAGKRLLEPRGAKAPYERCIRPGVCVRGSFTLAEVVHQHRVVTNHVVCATHFPLKAQAVLGVRNLQRSHCYLSPTQVSLDVNIEAPCEVEWKMLRPEKSPALAFNTVVDGQPQLVFLSLSNTRNMVPYAVKARCYDSVQYDELDIRIACDELVVDNVFVLGSSAFVGKRLFFDDGFVGVTSDPDCSGATVTSAPTLPRLSTPPPLSPPLSPPSYRFRKPTAVHPRDATNDFTAVYAFVFVFVLALAAEVWQQSRFRR